MSGKRLCEDHGFSCRVKSLDPPNYVEKDAPFVTALTEVYRQVMGLSEDAGEPYVMGGSLYRLDPTPFPPLKSP